MSCMRGEGGRRWACSRSFPLRRPFLRVLVPAAGQVGVKGSHECWAMGRTVSGGSVDGHVWTPTPGQNLPILRWIICRVGQAACPRDTPV